MALDTARPTSLGIGMTNKQAHDDRPCADSGTLSAGAIDLGLAGGMAAATVGFMAGYLTIRIGADHPTWRNADGSTGFVFADDDAIRTWTLLVAGEVAMWAVLLTPLIGWYRRVRPARGDRGYAVEALAVVILFVALVLIPQILAPNAAMPIHHYYGRIRALSGLACVVVAPGLAGFVAIRRRAREYTRGRWDAVELEVSSVVARRILFAIGSIVSGALLATGFASRIIHDRDPSDTSLSHDLVLLYGLLFSGLLALVFVPTYVGLEEARRCQIDSLPAHLKATGEIEAMPTRETSAFRILTQYVFVRSPLMSAVVAGFLGK